METGTNPFLRSPVARPSFVLGNESKEMSMVIVPVALMPLNSRWFAQGRICGLWTLGALYGVK